MIRFSILNGARAGDKLHFDGDLIRIGRSPRADVELPEVQISGDHASIIFDGSDYVIRDHHSTNGTRIVRDDVVINLGEEKGRESVLRDGDCLSFGTVDGAIEFDVEITEMDDVDAAQIVSTRSVRELGDVEKRIAGDSVKALYDAQKEMSFANDLRAMTDMIAKQVFDFVPKATHITVVLREPQRGRDSRASKRYIPVGSRVRGQDLPSHEIPVTRSVFRKVISERKAVLAADAKKDVGETASMMAAEILSTIGVPLWQGDDIMGVLQVDNRDASGVFREEDFDIVALLAQSASAGFARARLIRRLEAAEERQRNQNLYLKKREEHRRVDGVIGESRAMQGLFDQLRKVVDTRITVLIQGETGTGKELIASAVHYWSERRDELFVAQNCAALPENLLESELFGHKRGAFTGATSDKKGLFELANGGTLFLDEIGEMPFALQAKLLRVLQEGEFRPVGSGVTKQADVRIVAATNRDLAAEVERGAFREDLFYRLSVFPLQVPALRERRDDIVLLANHFLRRYAENFSNPVEGFSQVAMEQLQRYEWPGNVRELENEVQRLVIQVEPRGFVQVEHLSDQIRTGERTKKGAGIPIQGTLKSMMAEVERGILRDALREHDNNKSATAKTLGITREGLHKKLRNYGMV